MDLGSYLAAELDDTVVRLTGQVLDLIPLERQRERMPGGNSVVWASYHVARHARLALQVAGAVDNVTDPRLADFAADAVRGGAGLQEVEQSWLAEVDPRAVRAYAQAVLGDVRAFVSGLSPDELDRRPDIEAALRTAGIEADTFGWLYQMWGGQSLAFLVRWPMIGHVTNHVGEMISTRNQMGLSPFR